MSLSKSFSSIVFSVILGVILFFAAYPAYILNPNNIDWLLYAPSTDYLGMDLHPHYLGWAFFRNASLSFPIGAINDFVYPLNTYLAYTDSLPLMAILFKPFSSILPDDFQYLGFWVFLCCIFQGYFAVRILKRWITDPVCLTLASVVVTFAPVLVWRSNHIALLSQWLLLWAIDLNAENYWARKSKIPAATPVIRPMLLVGLATLIQPYLAAMSLGICWALPLSECLEEWKTKVEPKQKWKIFNRLLLKSIGLAAPMLLVLYVFGFFKGESRSVGFHWFEADLIGFLNNHHTSFIFPSFRRKAGLHEGYGWPGLGVWAMALFLIYLLKKRLIKIESSNFIFRAIAIVCGVMFFFAMGERIFVGSFWLIDMGWFWNRFSFISQSFRACGRFVWPTYYVLMLLIPVAIFRTQRLDRARILLGIALIIQAIDMGPWLLKRGLRYPLGHRMKISQDLWQSETSGMRHIQLVPPEIEHGPCERNPKDQWYEWVEFANIAAHNHMTINSGYLARYDRLTTVLMCGAHWTQFILGPLAKDTIYIVRRGYEDELPIMGADRTCKTIDGFVTCKASTKIN